MASQIPKKSEICIGVDVIPMLRQLKIVGDVSIQPVAEALHEVICSGNYSLKPRFMLEKSTTELHFIPYIKVTNEARNKVMIYQRPARDDGEARLDGNFSIGLGGHPDSGALRYDADVLSLEQSLWQSAWSEFIQEIRIEAPCEPKPETDGWDSIDITETVIKSIQPIGFIYDPSDDVGLTHVAVLFEVIVPDDVLFVANSPTEVREPKWLDLIEAKEGPQRFFENWTRLWIKQSAKEPTRLRDREVFGLGN